MPPTDRRTRRRFGVAALTVAAAATLTFGATATPAVADAFPVTNPFSTPGPSSEALAVTLTAQRIMAHSGPGVAIAIVKSDPADPARPVTTAYYFGSADKAAGTPVAPQTQFEIASETKTFTAALLAKRIADGQSQLSDLAQDYAHGVTLPTEAGAAITLGDLVTHRSGLTDDPPNLDKPCEGRIMCNPKALYDRDFLWQGLEAPGALHTAPGTSWLYSDFGFGTLGTLMADAFGPGRDQPPFGPVVQRELTGPLGMTATTLESRAANLAQPYADGHPTDLWDNTAALAGGGGLVSTVSDMATWAAATLGYGDNPLVPVLQSMITAIPGPSNPVQKDMQMGMGWQLYPSSGITPAHAFKNGGAAGSTSATYLVPARGWAVTVLNNGHNMDLVTAATKDLMSTLAPNTSETATGSSGSLPWGSSGS
ncbi:serine hydrolase domain-containing protein [Prescottella soli]|uniref:Serine hydrolase domain-containing protein n=1 Tax=Prescottella soli TaxID=1543852 RepID=A0ABW9FSN3_9NOCA